MTPPSLAPLSPATNRRALARKALRGPATLAHQGQVASVQLADISGEGVGLLSPRPIAPGRRGELAFSLPLAGGDRPVIAAVRVMHSSYLDRASFRIGLGFTGLDAETAAAILAYVDAG